LNGRTILVTDGEQRAALAVVRSLGASGYRCIVATSSRPSIAGGSRFVERTVGVPDALKRPVEFADAIATLAALEHVDVVLPITEQSLLALLPIRALLGPSIIPFPDLYVFNSLTDKERLLADASSLGIAIPGQEVIRDVDSIASTEFHRLQYPVVIKPARSVGELGGVRATFSVSYASNAVELERGIHALPQAAFPLLLQQRIVGPGIGIFLMIWDGELRAQFAHQRLSEKPPSGGISVYRESVPMDKTLRDQSVALLNHFGWRGVAMVEYKRDSATGQTYLMEVNGRFWGSLQLAIDSGVDFPRILVDCALGEPSTPIPSYRVGVRSRWWWGQIDHLAGRLRNSVNSDHLPPGTRSTGRACSDLILAPFRRGDYEEILRWSDPRPFLNETIRWIGGR